MDGHETDILDTLQQVVNRLLHDREGRAHDDDDALRVLRAIVLEDLVAPASDLPDHVHVLLDDLGDLLVVHSVRLLDIWEEDVRALRRPALFGVIGVDVATSRLVEVQVIELLD